MQSSLRGNRRGKGILALAEPRKRKKIWSGSADILLAAHGSLMENSFECPRLNTSKFIRKNFSFKE
jgi:hypothetical protein